MINRAIRRARRLFSLKERVSDSPWDIIDRIGTGAACYCELDQYAHEVGFRFNSWNPFVNTARHIALGNYSYQESPLYSFYSRWHPGTAAAGLIGFQNAPSVFAEWPVRAAHAVPWMTLDLAAAVRHVDFWTHRDYAPHGVHEVSMNRAYKYGGPVDDDIGKLEVRRYTILISSLRERGYDARLGYVRNIILKRGAQLLFVTKGGGMHRTVAMYGLGHKVIPAVPKALIDIDAAADWPQVRSGLWDVSDAKAYFNHLFDFDYGKWARRQNIEMPGAA
jgi:hypothetical protein